MKKNFYILVSSFFVVSLSAQASWAKTQKRKVVKKESKSNAQNNRPSTVADILSRYNDSDRGANTHIQKFSKLLPTTSLPQSTVIRNVKQIKPPSSMAFFIKSNEKENQIEVILDQQIQDLYSLSQKFRKSPERGEIWLRLGELYVEKAKMVQMRIQDDLDKKIAKWEAQGRKGAPPRGNTDAPFVYNRKAIQLYDWYIRDFPKSRKLDQAYFFLGYNYVALNQFKKGMAYYEKLTKDFPRSSYITETHFALAEYYFENNNYKKAEVDYKLVLRDEKSRIYPFAIYKLAWTNYRLGKPAIAIKYLEKVIELSRLDQSRDTESGRSVNRIRLGEEAFNDLVLFYPDAKSYRQAAEYFEQMGSEEKVYPSLEKLAQLYSDRGQREAAKYIYDLLIEMKPTAPKNFDFQYQVVQNYWSGGDRQIFRQELYNWITQYNENSNWGRANPKELTRAFETKEATLRGYILQEHKALQKSHSPAGQKLTRNLYELYIKELGKSKNIAEMRFFYGELLYDMGEFDRASTQYKWVITNAPESQYYSTAILNELLSLEKSLPTEKELDQARGKSLEPFAFNEVETNFLTAAQSYTQKFPNEDRAVDVQFKIGRLYYSHNYFDQAMPVFKSIVAQHPKTKFAVYSANLILDIYNLKKDYEGLAKAGQELLTTSGLKSADINMDVADVVQRAKFKEAQDKEVAKDYLGSAQSFEGFAKAYPGSKYAPVAKYNAGINYERVGDLTKAAALYASFVAIAPKDNEKQKKEAKRLLGRIYERTGQLKKAALDFEDFAKEYPKDPLTPDLYYNSAVIWAGFKNYNRAIQNYENYYNTSKKANRVDAIFLIADLYEKKGALTQANKNFERYVNDNPRNMTLVIQATYRIAKNSQKMNQIAKSEEWFNKLITLNRRAGGDMGAREAAEGKFLIAVKKLGELKNIRMPSNPTEQGKAIQNKLAALNVLNQEMIKIVKLDVAEFVIAALETAGEGYEHVADTIYHSAIPKGLNADQQKQYMDQIEKVAGPLKQQGIDNYSNAIQKSRDLDVYNEWTVKARHGLGRLKKTETIDEEVILDYSPSGMIL